MLPVRRMPTHHGMGNKLSMERIHLLNQKNNSNFKLQDSLPVAIWRCSSFEDHFQVCTRENGFSLVQ
jgi:hypothetical protein